MTPTSIYLGLVLVCCLFLIANSIEDSVSSNSSPRNDNVLSGKLELLEGIEFVYEFPPIRSESSIKGIIVFAHGCGHSSLDWWPQSASCPSCRPLPAERILISKAIERGLVAIAISSPNRKHKCWHHTEDQQHVLNVVRHVKQVLSSYIRNNNPTTATAEGAASAAVVSQTTNPATIRTDSIAISTDSDSTVSPFVNQLPFFVFGVSSGGSLAASLASDLQPSNSLSANNREKISVSAIVLQISYLHHIPITSSLPPILFHYMKKDFRMSMSIIESLSELSTSNVKAKAISIAPKPLRATFEQYNVLTPPQRDRLISALQQHKLVDADGYLVEDPRHIHREWHQIVRDSLPEVVPAMDTLVADESPISELLNIAFGSHEISADNSDEIMDWLLSVSK